MKHPKTFEIQRLEVSLAPIPVEGELALPERAKGLVIFVHGSGSSRFSQRNRYVANQLQDAGYATLLVDLLSVIEDQDERARFDIGLLANRVSSITEWVKTHSLVGGLPRLYFGASTGAAAALVAAALHPGAVRSIVSRGGRPDLAGDSLPLVQAPTLLIVGGEDRMVLELNRESLERLNSESRLKIVPGASHLFEEPGALEEVARLAREWFDAATGPAEA